MTNTIGKVPFFVFLEGNQSRDRVVETLAGIIKRINGFNRVNVVDEAKLVFTDSSDKSLIALKEDCCVIQLSLAESPSGAAEGLVRHFPDRFRILAEMNDLLLDIQKSISYFRDQLVLESNFDFEAIDVADDIVGQRFLILDDTRRNRDVAIAQLGQKNHVEVFSSYQEALNRLSKEEQAFNFVLTDLMMPTESFMLGLNREAIIGQPIAAGMFVILAALKAGVPNVGLVTFGSHHEVPELAALDYLKSFTRSSVDIKIENRPNFIQGGKDWASVIRTFNKETEQ